MTPSTHTSVGQEMAMGVSIPLHSVSPHNSRVFDLNRTDPRSSLKRKRSIDTLKPIHSLDGREVKGVDILFLELLNDTPNLLRGLDELCSGPCTVHGAFTVITIMSQTKLEGKEGNLSVSY